MVVDNTGYYIWFGYMASSSLAMEVATSRRTREANNIASYKDA